MLPLVIGSYCRIVKHITSHNNSLSRTFEQSYNQQIINNVAESNNPVHVIRMLFPSFICICNFSDKYYTPFIIKEIHSQGIGNRTLCAYSVASLHCI
jgi:hypothetical protein